MSIESREEREKGRKEGKEEGSRASVLDAVVVLENDMARLQVQLRTWRIAVSRTVTCNAKGARDSPGNGRCLWSGPVVRWFLWLGGA